MVSDKELQAATEKNVSEIGMRGTTRKISRGDLVSFRNRQWKVVNIEDNELTLDDGSGRTAYASPAGVKLITKGTWRKSKPKSKSKSMFGNIKLPEVKW